MTDDAAHYIFYSTLAICATVLTLVFLFVRARSRRRIPAPVLRHAVDAHQAGSRMPLGARHGFKPRMILTMIGGAVMIPELFLPVVGEIVDLGIFAVLAYSWYSFFKQPLALGPPPRILPDGVDECIRCHGTGFTDGAIDPLCAGKGWVPARNQPLE
jgi:hypothetical protein